MLIICPHTQIESHETGINVNLYSALGVCKFYVPRFSKVVPYSNLIEFQISRIKKEKENKIKTINLVNVYKS